MPDQPLRVGVVGFGSIGQYLVKSIQSQPDTLALAFVWNRTTEKIRACAELAVPEDRVLERLEDVGDRAVDLIVEVAHQSVSERYADLFLRTADYMPGSPTAFACKALQPVLERCVPGPRARPHARASCHAGASEASTPSACTSPRGPCGA